MAGGMEPAMERFLRRACTVAQHFDHEGSGVLPVEAWPLLLQSLELEEQSDGAEFLMDYFTSAGPGVFSYVPLLRVLGLECAPPRPQQQQEPMRAPTAFSTPPRSPVERRGDGRDMWGSDGRDGYRDPSTPDGRQRGQQLEQEPRCAGSPGSTAPAASTPIQSPAAAAAAAAVIASPGSPRGCDLRVENVCGHMEEEDEETFWAKRGPIIKQLFSQWDANQISNETFAGRMQEQLGQRVDVMEPECEFQRLTNKHRAARNLKFAALISAVRRDAHKTRARLSGYPASSCGSFYEPSECGSETPSQAAGRPTGAPSNGRRRLELGSDSRGSGGGSYPRSGDSNILLSSRAPSAIGGYEPRQLPYAPWDAAPQKPAEGVGKDVIQDIRNTADYQSRVLPSRSAADQWECKSQFSDVASEADSQREHHILRNRTGHGNILTWGADSRSITPRRQRPDP